MQSSLTLLAVFELMRRAALSQYGDAGLQVEAKRTFVTFARARADVFRNSNQREEAAACYLRALSAVPNDPRLLRCYARSCASSSQLDVAERAFCTALFCCIQQLQLLGMSSTGISAFLEELTTAPIAQLRPSASVAEGMSRSQIDRGHVLRLTCATATEYASYLLHVKTRDSAASDVQPELHAANLLTLKPRKDTKSDLVGRAKKLLEFASLLVPTDR